MKLKYKYCLDTLNSILNFKPTHTDIAKIINVSANALSNRLSNDGYLKKDEIKKIEQFYNTSFVEETDLIDIDFYPEDFGCFNKNRFIFSKNKKSLKIPKKCFENFSKLKHYSIITAQGDTMNPYIKDRDKLIVEHWCGGQIIDNRVYVFCFNNEIFAKRLVNNIDQIAIKSDNEIYPIRFINKKEITSFIVIGQIVGLLRNLKN